jgi:hypothetical protein
MAYSRSPLTKMAISRPLYKKYVHPHPLHIFNDIALDALVVYEFFKVLVYFTI